MHRYTFAASDSPVAVALLETGAALTALTLAAVASAAVLVVLVLAVVYGATLVCGADAMDGPAGAAVVIGTLGVGARPSAGTAVGLGFAVYRRLTDSLGAQTTTELGR